MKLSIMEIKKQMAKQRLTNTKLSELIGMSRQNINTILTRGTCSIVNTGRLARALGVDVAEIMKED